MDTDNVAIDTENATDGSATLNATTDNLSLATSMDPHVWVVSICFYSLFIHLNFATTFYLMRIIQTGLIYTSYLICMNGQSNKISNI